MAILEFLIQQWFLIGIAIVIVLGWRFPNVAAEGGVIRSEYSISYGAIALIFLITGLTLSTPALLHQLRNYRLHIFTQTFSFFFFSSIVFAIVNCVKASGNERIDEYVLAGMVVMSVMPTTVASNITMTRMAGGSTEAATMQVCIGNLIGAFITPLLCEMFFNSSTWAFGRPVAKGGYEGSAGLKEVYRQLAKQLGLSLFVPLITGQIIRYLFPIQTKYLTTTLRLAKFSTFLLLLLIWSVFSTQFQQDAFASISHVSIVFVCLVNFALYIGFTIICVCCTRLPFLSEKFDLGPRIPVPGHNLEHQRSLSHNPDEDADPTKHQPQPRWRSIISAIRFDKKEATAICFCAAAKGMVVGAPTLSILYGGLPSRKKAIMSIPLVIYQGQQVAVAQMLVYLFRQWNQKPDRLAGIREHNPRSQRKTGTKQQQCANPASALAPTLVSTVVSFCESEGGGVSDTVQEMSSVGMGVNMSEKAAFESEQEEK